MSFLFIAICLLLFNFFLLFSAACYTHADCSEGRLVAYCLRVKCIPISKHIRSLVFSPEPDESAYESPEPELETGIWSSNLTLSEIIKLTNKVKIPQAIRRATLRQIRYLNEQINVNDQVYRAIHRQSVSRLLKRIAKRQTRKTSTYAFHKSVLKAFRKTHDQHFRYFPTYPLEGTVATLGFTISRYFTPDGKPSFVLSDFVPGFRFPECFTRGSHVKSVDGVPIDQVVDTLAQDMYGSNEDAKTQLAVDALTIRQAVQDPLPKEEYSTINVRSASGRMCTVSARWEFSLFWDEQTLSAISTRRVSLTTDAPSYKKKPNGFFPNFPHQHRTALNFFTARQESFPRRTYLKVDSSLKDFLSVSIVKTSVGDVGIMKLSAFPVLPEQYVIDELTRLLRKVPQTGLIVDTRDNQGGIPSLCTVITKLISAVDIPKMPFSLRASELTVRAARVNTTDEDTQGIFKAFETANIHALKVKDKYTGPASDINTLFSLPNMSSLRQVYTGPVITLTSAISYSGGDLFALMQKDLGASYVIGTDRATGGGGGGIISFQWIAYYFPDIIKDTRFVEDADIVLPFFRFYRAGSNSGGLVEHFGVEPNERYKRTLDDVLDGDLDMIEYAAKKFQSLASE